MPIIENECFTNVWISSSREKPTITEYTFITIESPLFLALSQKTKTNRDKKKKMLTETFSDN